MHHQTRINESEVNPIEYNAVTCENSKWDSKKPIVEQLALANRTYHLGATEASASGFTPYTNVRGRGLSENGPTQTMYVKRCTKQTTYEGSPWLRRTRLRDFAYC